MMIGTKTLKTRLKEFVDVLLFHFCLARYFNTGAITYFAFLQCNVIIDYQLRTLLRTFLLILLLLVVCLQRNVQSQCTVRTKHLQAFCLILLLKLWMERSCFQGAGTLVGLAKV